MVLVVLALSQHVLLFIAIFSHTVWYNTTINLKLRDL